MPLFRNRPAALLAIFALAFQALVPVLARAQPASSISMPICSADGDLRTIDVPVAPHGNQRAAKHLKHCALCTGGDRAQAVDAPAVPVVFVVDSVFESPAAQPAAAFKSTAVSPAQPRAPPVQS